MNRLPTKDEFSRMRAVEVNRFFESREIDWRVADFDGSIAESEERQPDPHAPEPPDPAP